MQVHAAGDAVAVTVSLHLPNTGSRDGAEVVQVYFGDRSQILQMPDQELRAFTKTHLRAGATRRVDLTIARDDLAHYHPEAGWVFTGGPLAIRVGSSSRDIRLEVDVDVPGQAVEIPLTL